MYAILRIVVGASVTLLVLGACATATPVHYSDSPWEDDLDVIQTKLPRLHKNLFHSLPRQDFDARIDALRRRLPELTDLEVRIALRRIFAAIGESPTAPPS